MQIFPGHTYIYVNKSVLAPQAFHMHAAGPVLGILRATGPLRGDSAGRFPSQRANYALCQFFVAGYTHRYVFDISIDAIIETKYSATRCQHLSESLNYRVPLILDVWASWI
mgnify:CR=1 FL=1